MFVPLKIMCRGVYFFSSFHWIKVYGKPDMRVAAMTVAPHYSFFDSLISVYLNFCNTVAKHGLDEVTFFGPLVKLCQPIIVNRETYNSRNTTVERITERAKARGKWTPILLFPEGTCTNGKQLIKFKAGGFLPGLPIQPVCIKYTGVDSEKSYDSVSWTWLGSLVFFLPDFYFYKMKV
jgi:lysophosphatidylcholine acyltransferase/lyso-PAF acetyltransferase